MLFEQLVEGWASFVDSRWCRRAKPAISLLDKDMALGKVDASVRGQGGKNVLGMRHEINQLTAPDLYPTSLGLLSFPLGRRYDPYVSL